MTQPIPPPLPRRKRSKLKIGCLSFFGLFIFLTVIGMLSQGPDNKGRPTQPAAPKTAAKTKSKQIEDDGPCLKLVYERANVDDFSTTVIGTVKNNCGRDYSYVQISFKLFDSANNVIGTALANQSNLSAGETWKFSAVGFARCHTYRLDELTGL